MIQKLQSLKVAKKWSNFMCEKGIFFANPVTYGVSLQDNEVHHDGYVLFIRLAT